MTDAEKAQMLDILIDDIIREYNEHPPVDKKFHSRAEKIGYCLIIDLESNGFITDSGIQGK